MAQLSSRGREASVLLKCERADVLMCTASFVAAPAGSISTSSASVDTKLEARCHCMHQPLDCYSSAIPVHAPLPHCTPAPAWLRLLHFAHVSQSKSHVSHSSLCRPHLHGPLALPPHPSPAGPSAHPPSPWGCRQRRGREGGEEQEVLSASRGQRSGEGGQATPAVGNR